ncbi:MAG: hypothetical protein ACI8TF_000999 [Paracoccaceae bacterium]|jgi:hypothetical protein
MTALSEYDRLEAPGLWRETEGSQRREVIVSLGDATLIISALSETALSHWSLPALHRLNPGRIPALYAPDRDAEEQLELSETHMIDAIEKVRTAIERRRPHPGRLRLYLGGTLSVITIALCVWLLPQTLLHQTVGVLPDATRQAVGQRLLNGMADLAGRPCRSEAGQIALRRLARSVLGPNAPDVVVLPSTAQPTAHLPGHLFVVNRSLVEDYEVPEVLAGYLLAEDLRLQRQDPMERLLEEVGLRATFHLLTTGEISATYLRSHGASLLTTSPEPVSENALIDRFDAAGISSEPFAYAIDLSGESTLGLIEGDPLRGRLRVPLLSDEDWISLQEICGS